MKNFYENYLLKENIYENYFLRQKISNKLLKIMKLFKIISIDDELFINNYH